RGRDLPRTNTAHDAPPRADKVPRDDPPVAPPPHRLRAHDRAPPFLSQNAQPGEPGLEGLAQRVISVIVKALILPERIYGRRNLLRFRPQAAERGNMFVSDRKLRQRFGKDLAVILRVGARARNGSDIGHEFDLLALQQVDEIAHRAGRMSDSEEWVGHMRDNSPAQEPKCGALV